MVPDLDAAVALVGTHPRVRAVTAAGDLVGADWAVGGQSERAVQPRRAGAGRRGRGASWPAPSTRAAELADRARRGPRRGAAPAPPTSRPRSPPGRPPTARAPPSPRSSPSSGPPPARRPPRPSGTSPPGSAPRGDLEQVAGRRSPGSSSGWPTPRPRRSRRSPRPRRATGCAPRSPPPARPRPRPGSPSAPRRSGPAPCTAGPSRCAARPARSAPPASGRPPPGSPGSGAPPWRPRVRADAETALAALATSLARAAAERDALAVGPQLRPRPSCSRSGPASARRPPTSTG